MSDGTQPKLPKGEPPQEAVGFRSNPEWEALVAETGDRLAALDDLDGAPRAAVEAALAGIDAVHREALHRLVRLFKEGVLETVVTDPAIHTLMGMYGLLPEETPGCQKVWDFLPKDEDSGVATDPAGAPPHWAPAPLEALPGDGDFAVCRMEEGALVVARVQGTYYAFAAGCPDHGKLMLDGTLADYSWACPHGRGCLYDIRSGARLGGGAPLDCRPIREEGGKLWIGFGIPFQPNLPAT